MSRIKEHERIWPMGETYATFAFTYRWFLRFFPSSVRQEFGEKMASFWKYLIGFLLLPGLLVPVLACGAAAGLLDSDTKPRAQWVELSDLNGNGHLDAFVVVLNENNRILLNDGNGRFTMAGQPMLIRYGLTVDDIYRDARMAAASNQRKRSEFVSVCVPVPVSLDSDTQSGGAFGQTLAIKDANTVTVFTHVGADSNSRRCLGEGRVRSAALGDLNGNGAVDVFLANSTTSNVENDYNYKHNTPNSVWLNDGQGNMSDSGQQLGQAESTAVALGDLNGNGFPDAVVGNRGPDEIWFNDGQGNFSGSGQQLGSGLTRSVFLFDLDGDGDLDVFVAGETAGRAWLNDGAGRFTAGQSIGYGRRDAVAVGDLNGNGYVDVLVAGVATYQVWHNDGHGRFTAGRRVGYQ
jgi:hypothetical protein